MVVYAEKFTPHKTDLSVRQVSLYEKNSAKNSRQYQTQL